MLMMDYQMPQDHLKREYKINHCLGTRQAWLWIRANSWKPLNNTSCDSSIYSKIINSINKLLAESLLEGHTIVFPYKIGRLSIQSVKTYVKLKNGVLKDNYRTDWKTTLKYWQEDPDAQKAHKRIKRIQKYLYFIRYSRRGSSHRYKAFYKFRANRSLVRLVGHEIEKRSLKVARLD